MKAERRAALVRAIGRGRVWLQDIVDGRSHHRRLATEQKCSIRHINMTISLTFLAPALVSAAVEGRFPRGIGVGGPPRCSGRVVAADGTAWSGPNIPLQKSVITDVGPISEPPFQEREIPRQRQRPQILPDGPRRPSHTKSKRQMPAQSGPFSSVSENARNSRLDGGGRSQMRTGLRHRNSLLSGKITGKIVISSLQTRFPTLERPEPQPFFMKFPASDNREYFLRNREIISSSSDSFILRRKARLPRVHKHALAANRAGRRPRKLVRRIMKTSK